MDEVSHSIAHSIKTGQYFEDARKWYISRYVFAVSERAYLSIIALIIGVSLVVSIYVINQTLPIRSKIELILRTPNTLDRYLKVSSIIDLEHPDAPDLAIKKYLVNNYVKTREAYVYEDANAQVNKIKNISSKQVYRAFYNYMSLENGQSPILLYKKQIKRSIRIISTTPTDNKNNFIVKFEATIENIQSKQQRKTSWLANVVFYIPDNIVKIAKSEKINFRVTDYNIRKLD